MAKLGQITEKIRSKNAGPFWLTIDVFCGSERVFEQVSEGLLTESIADIFGIKSNCIKRFDIRSLNAIKISLPRPAIQGSIEDRDMHGASWAALLQELEL